MFPALVCSCLLLSTALAGLVEQQQQSASLEEAPSLLYRGAHLRCFQSGELRIVEPFVALQLPLGAGVRPDPIGQGHYFTVSLEIETSVKLPEDTARKWELLKLQSFKVELRKAVDGSCASKCPLVSVSGRWEKGQQPMVTFRCRERAACQNLLRTLRFTGSDHEELRSSLKFTFQALANGAKFELTRVGLPVSNAVSKPFSNAFWIEGDKLLLYTVEANSGILAYETYQAEQTYVVPKDGSLPKIYRSALVDQLDKVAATGNWQIVAEMRTAGRMVSQAVFSAEPAGLDKNSWFRPSRLVSTYPFWFGRSNSNIFSTDGDVRSVLRRRFMINRHYGGCESDTGLFTVSDMRDACQYSNAGWKGKTPVLVYSTMDGVSYHQGSAAFADRFLIYLRLQRPVLPPFAVASNALQGAFHYEGDKLLLFTVKAHSGHQAVATFLNRQPSLNTATPGALPDAYRSDLIDSLGQTVVASGKQFIVAEMRAGDRMVAQVVFDASINRLSLDKQNWFIPTRVVSSHPYQAVRSLTQGDGFYHDPKAADPRFQAFSISGDTHWKRGFFLLYSYAGCPGDRAFWTVSDARDPCAWGYNAWRGAAPVLVYTESQERTLENGGAKYADRFLIYLK